MEICDFQIRKGESRALPLVLFVILLFPAANLFAQNGSLHHEASVFSTSLDFSLQDWQTSEKNSQTGATQSPNSTSDAQSSPQKAGDQSTPTENQQPKRIMGIMPNFRAVSAGTIPPPPTPRQSFKIATQNSFDYSSYLFVGLTSLMAEWGGTHKQLGKGVPGFGRYYWRGFVDKTDGNYLVIFVLPSILHEDERYYSLGKGGFWKRLTYSATRVVITPDYHGHSTFNASEIFGRGISQGISLAYYPSQSRTAGQYASKYAYAILRDAMTNSFREFWPDISRKVFKK